MIANVSILLISSLCIAYVGLNAYAVIRADDLIFPAPPPSYQDDARIVKLVARDGEHISAYHLKADQSDKLLLYSHGNGEDIEMARAFLENFKRMGISVIAYDYPGYGTSSGKPSEAGCYAAAEAAYLWATETLGYAPQNITLYGHSLGSGPSTWLAKQNSVSGLIFDGAFTSTFRVMTEVKLLLWDKFDNYARLPYLESPILIIHGTNDRTVPFSHALKNWKAAKGTKYKLFVDGAGHSDLAEVAGHEYWDIVTQFIQGDLK